MKEEINNGWRPLPLHGQWIALTGPMGSGKTTAANYLATQYGYLKYSLAKPLKEIATELFGSQRKDRKLLQDLGDAIKTIDRDIFCKHLWRRVLKQGIPHRLTRIVIDDLRFLHEEEFFRKRNFIIVLVKRNPAKCRAEGKNLDTINHPSEREWKQIKPDYILDSEGTVEDLYEDIDRLMGILRFNEIEGRSFYVPEGETEWEWFIDSLGRKRKRRKKQKKRYEVSRKGAGPKGEALERTKWNRMKHGLFHLDAMYCRFCPHRDICPNWNPEEDPPNQICRFEVAIRDLKETKQIKKYIEEQLGKQLLTMLKRAEISASLGKLQILSVLKVLELALKYLTLSTKLEKKEKQVGLLQKLGEIT